MYMETSNRLDEAVKSRHIHQSWKFDPAELVVAGRQEVSRGPLPGRLASQGRIFSSGVYGDF